MTRWNTTKHAFQAVQLDERGNESILDTFAASKDADAAYAAAQFLCEQARALPHRPCAFVREINSEGPS